VAGISEIPVWRKYALTLGKAGCEDLQTIVVVGAGPVGLTLALDLALKGHSVTVLNRLDFIPAGSKAICFARRSLDIWNRMGVAQSIVAEGVQWDVGKVFWRDAHEPIYQFDLRNSVEVQMPSFVNIPQYRVEELLVERLCKLPNVDLRWGHEVVSASTRQSDARIEVKAPDGTYTIGTEWLLACDGSRSPLRNMLGLAFEGRVFEDNFLIADIRIKQDRVPERWFWFDPPFNPQKSALLHKQPNDIWRIDFQLGWKIDREKWLRDEPVESLIQSFLGPKVPFEKEWYSVYTFQCRRMQRFVHGRIVFAGDSAHLVSPFGARGCNGGIADADNLAWKLDMIIKRTASRELLGSYNEEATATADENIRHSTRATDFMTPKSAGSEALRDAVLWLARDNEFAREFVNSGRLSSAVNYPYSSLSSNDSEPWASNAAPGSPAPDAPVDTGWLLAALGNRFALLSDGYEGRLPPGITSLRVDRVIDGGQRIRHLYDLTPGSAYLIRPDQYVAARWREPCFESIEAALMRATGGVS